MLDRGATCCIFMALSAEEDSGHMLLTAAATLLNGINKICAEWHQLNRRWAMGILPSSTYPLHFIEMFLLESRHVPH